MNVVTMRVNESDVRDIFDTQLDSNSLVKHIKAASSVVDEVQATGEVGPERLELIELYLAAHYATVQDPRVGSESVGSASYDYERTEYLEMADNLDPTNTVDQDTQDFYIHTPDF